MKKLNNYRPGQVSRSLGFTMAPLRRPKLHTIDNLLCLQTVFVIIYIGRVLNLNLVKYVRIDIFSFYSLFWARFDQGSTSFLPQGGYTPRGFKKICSWTVGDGLHMYVESLD